jgi:predicted membrane chloride channel (bestrophin family)
VDRCALADQTLSPFHFVEQFNQSLTVLNKFIAYQFISADVIGINSILNFFKKPITLCFI